MAGRDAAGVNRFGWVVFTCFITALLCAPFVRVIYAVSDEGILLDGADRMLRGQRLYTDVFALLPPGGFFIVTGWFAVAGHSMMAARILAVLTAVGIAAFTFMTCQMVSGGVVWSALLVLGWVIMSLGDGVQISHHWFTTFFIMICCWASVVSLAGPPQWRRWPLLSGAAAGAALMVTPPQGALAAIAALAAFSGGNRRMARFGCYLLASVVIPICLLSYVLCSGLTVPAFNDVIIFNFTRYSRVQAVPFAWLANQQDELFRYGFPLAGFLTIVMIARNWRSALSDQVLRTCVAFATAGFVGCFPRPDIFHISVSFPLSCPLIAYCMGRLLQDWRPRHRYAVAVVAIGLGLPAVRSYVWKVEKAVHGHAVTTPRGNLVLAVNGAQQLLARIEETPADDRYFFYPTEELLPFLSARGQVGPLDWLQPDYSTPAQYQDACVAMMRSAQWFVVARMDASGWKAMFPGTPNPDVPERLQFENVLNNASWLVGQYGWFDLRRRVPGIDASACDAITGGPPSSDP